MSYFKNFEDPFYDDDGQLIDEDGPMLEDEVMDLIAIYGTDEEAVTMIAEELQISTNEVRSVISSLGFEVTDSDDEFLIDEA